MSWPGHLQHLQRVCDKDDASLALPPATLWSAATYLSQVLRGQAAVSSVDCSKLRRGGLHLLPPEHDRVQTAVDALSETRITTATTIAEFLTTFPAFEEHLTLVNDLLLTPASAFVTALPSPNIALPPCLALQLSGDGPAFHAYMARVLRAVRRWLQAAYVGQFDLQQFRDIQAYVHQKNGPVAARDIELVRELCVQHWLTKTQIKSNGSVSFTCEMPPDLPPIYCGTFDIGDARRPLSWISTCAGVHAVHFQQPRHPCQALRFTGLVSTTGELTLLSMTGTQTNLREPYSLVPLGFSALVAAGSALCARAFHDWCGWDVEMTSFVGASLLCYGWCVGNSLGTALTRRWRQSHLPPALVGWPVDDDDDDDDDDDHCTPLEYEEVTLPSADGKMLDDGNNDDDDEQWTP